MSRQPIYISRKCAEELQAAFASALNNPENSPTLFQIWGVGGVGKTTLKDKLRRECSKQADFAEESFNFISMGLDVEISDPISLMNQLYKQLEPKFWQRDLLQGKDPFLSLYKLYYQTIHQLESQPLPNKPKVTEEQTNLVKGLLRNGVRVAGLFGGIPEEVSSTVAEKAGDRIVEGAKMMLNEADRWKDFLEQHRATKQKRDLQELMLKPLPKLTEAFVTGLQGRKRPVVLVLDTYEQAPPEIDTWLLYLLSRTNLTQTNIKLLIAGRRNLLDREPWRKLQQDKNAIYERSLACFDGEQTAAYLKDIEIIASSDVEKIAHSTKGLPYSLNKVREWVEQDKSLDFSAIDREVEALLLQGLDKREKLAAQLAACCRWFDRPLLNYLLRDRSKFQGESKEGEKERDWFDWLKGRGFVKYAQRRWSLDDVARDTFRESLYLENRDLFEQINAHLADYFQQQADREVPADRHPVEKYKNSAWRDNISEFIYYLLHSDRDDYQVKFLSHLFESRYLEQDYVARTPVLIILAELDSGHYLCVKESKKDFLDIVNPIISRGWVILGKDKIDYKFLELFDFSREQIDNSLRICLQNADILNSLQGLAKYAALFYKSKFCNEREKLNWLRMANEQAKKCLCVTDPEFSLRVFLWDLGNFFNNLGQYEQALASYNKAIEFKPDKPESWNNRGVVLDDLGRYEEAIASYDKAIEIKPDDHEAWYNLGVTLSNLGRKEEAIASYDRAIEIKPDLHEAWYSRGNALGNLGRKEEAIASYDKAIEFKPDKHDAWNNRGIALSNLGRKEEAIASYDKAIEFKPDDPSAFYNKSCCYALQENIKLTLENLQKAIELEPEKYRELAKTDSDFDRIRSDDRFQTILNPEAK
ncbi:MAG: tetratricopeptide repeat protein [Spirulina sp.]